MSKHPAISRGINVKLRLRVGLLAFFLLPVLGWEGFAAAQEQPQQAKPATGSKAVPVAPQQAKPVTPSKAQPGAPLQAKPGAPGLERGQEPAKEIGREVEQELEEFVLTLQALRAEIRHARELLSKYPVPVPCPHTEHDRTYGPNRPSIRNINVAQLEKDKDKDKEMHRAPATPAKAEQKKAKAR